MANKVHGRGITGNRVRVRRIFLAVQLPAVELIALRFGYYGKIKLLTYLVSAGGSFALAGTSPVNS